jgi:homoserine kinase
VTGAGPVDVVPGAAAHRSLDGQPSGRVSPAGSPGSPPRAGARATVRVPATSANLGPGFDSLGLALGLYDEVTLEVLDPNDPPPDPPYDPRLDGDAAEVLVTGEGAGQLPLDERHLVLRAARAAFRRAGVRSPALRLTCQNAVPHGRGLGSSAAAVVAGLYAARGCLPDPSALSEDDLLRLATGFEGHPDNAAAALLGGVTISWLDPATGPVAEGARAVRVRAHAELDVLLAVPSAELPTERARALLPSDVPHADAAFNAGRSALLVEAVTRRPDLLLPATEDRLHQRQRAAAMPASLELVGQLRAAGLAAVVSGAGPSVLVLGRFGELARGVDDVLAAHGVEVGVGVGVESGAWRLLRPGLSAEGAVLL